MRKCEWCKRSLIEGVVHVVDGWRYWFCCIDHAANWLYLREAAIACYKSRQSAQDISDTTSEKA